MKSAPLSHRKILLAAETLKHYISTKPKRFSLTHFLPKHRSHQKKLQQAINLLQRHPRFLQRLQKGNPEEQALYFYVEQTTKQYHQKVTQLSSKKWFRKLGKKHSLNIKFPLSPQALPPSTPEKLKNLYEKSLQEAPCQQEIDCFRIKALRAAEEKNLLPLKESVYEARKQPIVLEKEEKTAGTIVRLKQSWETMPGETVRFSATYKRHHNQSLPVGSMSCQIFSHVSSFPDPAFGFGFTLPETLLPHYLDNKPYVLKDLLIKKELFEKKLQPEGDYNQKAKRLFHEKKQNFLINKEQLLTTLQHFFRNTVVWEDSFEEFCQEIRHVNKHVFYLSEAIETALLNETFPATHWEHFFLQGIDKESSLQSLYATFLLDHQLINWIAYPFGTPKPKDPLLLELALYQQLYFFALLEEEKPVKASGYFNGLLTTSLFRQQAKHIVKACPNENTSDAKLHGGL